MAVPFRTALALAGAAALASCGPKKEAAPPPPPPIAVPAPPAKTLYDRLGGKAAIEAVVKDFAGRALKDARINKKFAKSDPDRLVTMLIDQVCNATGGPCQYTGRSMKETHRNLGVTEGEFTALVEDLTASLDSFKVAAADKTELLTALGSMKGDIVEKPGAATGTALPKTFVPWKKPAT